MALSSEPYGRPGHRDHYCHITNFLQSTVSNFVSLCNSPKSSTLQPSSSISPSTICVPLLFADSPKPPPIPAVSSLDSAQTDSVSSAKSATSGVSSAAESSAAFPTTVRISGLNSKGKGGGPAFVGQVFSMCDLSGTGLMAVSTHFDIPFISERTPKWLKKMFAAITKSERNGPVFRFFIDLGDAVSYVKKMNIPSGVVGACRLDLAYEQFKDKPHMFQFIPNEKQVKAANKLLKTSPQSGVGKKVDGVPVFSAQNLDIAIATSDGIKWYAPYFFDKNMLDDILEESADQHFQALIQTRHMQRRRDVIDDNLAAEVIEEMGDSLWDPPEVQEVLDEMGNPGIPLSVISKAAEIQFHYTVDKLLLGNRWLRKATGIQPKFPYIVDSFEKRSKASLLKASKSSGRCLANSESRDVCKDSACIDSSNFNSQDNIQAVGPRQNSLLPFGDWFRHLWPKEWRQKPVLPEKGTKEESKPNPFLPKITMVGISTEEAGQVSKDSLKKTMEDLTRELEKTEPNNMTSGGDEVQQGDRDPLFVANVGDYHSGMARKGSDRRIRRGNN